MITFKTIGNTDITDIVKMMQDFYAIDGYPIDPEKSKRLFEEFISNENLGKAWLIYEAEKLVGYTILTFLFNFEYGGKIAFVDELYLIESSRGKGIGKKTMQFLKEEAAKLSLKLLYLEVEPHNSDAQMLYLAAGFELHNRNIMKYKVKI